MRQQKWEEAHRKQIVNSNKQKMKRAGSENNLAALVVQLRNFAEAETHGAGGSTGSQLQQLQNLPQFSELVRTIKSGQLEESGSAKQGGKKASKGKPLFGIGPPARDRSSSTKKTPVSGGFQSWARVRKATIDLEEPPIVPGTSLPVRKIDTSSRVPKDPVKLLSIKPLHIEDDLKTPKSSSAGLLHMNIALEHSSKFPPLEIKFDDGTDLYDPYEEMKKLLNKMDFGSKAKETKEKNKAENPENYAIQERSPSVLTISKSENSGTTESTNKTVLTGSEPPRKSSISALTDRKLAPSDGKQTDSKPGPSKKPRKPHGQKASNMPFIKDTTGKPEGKEKEKSNDQIQEEQSTVIPGVKTEGGWTGDENNPENHENESESELRKRKLNLLDGTKTIRNKEKSGKTVKVPGAKRAVRPTSLEKTRSTNAADPKSTKAEKPKRELSPGSSIDSSGSVTSYDLQERTLQHPKVPQGAASGVSQFSQLPQFLPPAVSPSQIIIDPETKN